MGNGVQAWGVWRLGMISLVRSFTFHTVMPAKLAFVLFSFDFRTCLEIHSVLRIFRFLSFSRRRNYALEGIVIFF